MKYHRPYLVAFGASLCSWAIGCGTTYSYVTGKQAQLYDHLIVHVLAESVRGGQLQVDPATRDVLLKRDQELNPDGLEASYKQLQGDDSIDPGVSYTFRTGMSVEEVERIAGEPIARHKPESTIYDELMEYDFAFFYFRKNKLRHLKFKENLQNQSKPRQ